MLQLKIMNLELKRNTSVGLRDPGKEESLDVDRKTDRLYDLRPVKQGRSEESYWHERLAQRRVSTTTSKVR